MLLLLETLRNKDKKLYDNKNSPKMSYEWADIQLSIAGSTPILGITEINYGYSRDIENIYGGGSEPVSRGYGSKKYEASITIKLEEAQNLVAIAPASDLSQIPTFSIAVSWLDAENLVIKNTIQNCKFMNFDIKTKQGDKSTDITLNIVYAGLKVG